MCFFYYAGNKYERYHIVLDWPYLYTMKNSFAFFWIPFVVALAGFFLRGCH
jgi:hypothetical protein